MKSSLAPVLRSHTTRVAALLLSVSAVVMSGFFISQAQAQVTPSVVINEFMSNPSSGSEWVELYNPTGGDISASTLTLTELTNPSSASPTETDLPALSGNIPAGGFLTVDVSNLNNGGDSIGLYMGSPTKDVLLDRVTYGTVTGFPVTTGLSTAPGSNQSGYRTTDGGSTWAVGSPTKGFTNVPAPTVVTISTVAELRYAIEHQADGQTWNIAAGTYGLTAFDDITTHDETGWYFPITANNLTIKGTGNPTIYGTGYTTNGNWSTQNLISIFGNHVTIDGVTLMPKVEPNKTIEVLGSNTTIENVTIEPNTLTDQSEYASIPHLQDQSDEQHWGGSIYFNGSTSTQTLENVTIQNGGISDHATSGTLNLTNVSLTYDTNVDWINGYRYAFHGNTVNGTPTVTYHVDSTLNNLDSVIANLQDGDTIVLDSDITTAKQITIAKNDVTIEGNGHVLTANFSKTDTSNNSALGIDSNGVTVNNLVVDGSGKNLHGINVFDANDITLNGVTVQNNGQSGLNIVSSEVTVDNITTKNNGWHGIDVDLSSGTVSNISATLTVNGLSTHVNEIGGDIYVDDTTKNVTVVDTNHQYSVTAPVTNPDRPNDAVYSLIPATPANLTLKTSPGNSDIANGGYTNSYGIVASWDAVAGADHYKYEYWNDISGSPYDSAHPYVVTLSTTTLSGVFNQGEGMHHIAVSACDIADHCSTHPATVTVTYDKTAPGAPTITAPGARTWHKETPISDSWTAVADAGGIAKYQIAYSYDDGHSFAASTCPDETMAGVIGFIGCRDVSGTSRNHVPGPDEQGGVTVWVRALDNAGNVGPWSQSVHYYYDHEAPTTDISVSVSGTELTVSGDASDNLALNRVYVQLVSRQDGHRYGDTTINLIPEGKTAHWTKTYDIKSLGYPYGDFAANVSVVDMAGNSSNPGWTADYLVGEPVPPKIEDTTVPSVVITSATQSPANTVSFDGSISDNDLNYYYCYLTTDQTIAVGGATTTPGQEVQNTRNSACVTTWAKGQNSFTGTLGGFDVTGLPSGNYTINLVARDVAGNSNASTPATFKIAIDHSVALVSPMIVSPMDGSATTTVGLQQVSWTATAGMGVTYLYQSSLSDATTTTGAFTRPAYTSSPLTTTYIRAAGTPAGTYYLHVMAKDSSGKTSAWSPIVKVTVMTALPLTYTYATTTVQQADLDTTSSDKTIVANDGLDKWFFYSDTNDTIDNSLGSFVTGPGTAPAGSGSAQMTLGATPADRVALATYQFSGTLLANIKRMQYSLYEPTNAGAAPSLQFNVDLNGTDAWQHRLLYEPSENGQQALTLNSWNTIDAYQNGNATWTWSGLQGHGGTATEWPDGKTAEYRTWYDLVSSFPKARVRVTDSWLGFRIGSPGPAGYTSDVDKFVIDITDGLNATTTTYDFEPTAAVDDTPSLGGGAGTILGDLNGDGEVDFRDFGIMMFAFGKRGANLVADLNHDGVVDAADFAILFGNWTK